MAEKPNRVSRKRDGGDGDERIAVVLERGDEIAERGIAGRQSDASGPGDGEEDTAAGAAGNPDGVSFGDAGEGGGIVLVVGDGDCAAKVRTESGALARTSAIDCGSWPPVAGIGIDDAADAEWAVDECGDGAGADVRGYSGADAVGGQDVVLAGGQGGAFAGVPTPSPKRTLVVAVGLIECGEDAGGGLLLVEGGDFFPGDSVGANLKGAEPAGWGAATECR